jgi:protease I
MKPDTPLAGRKVCVLVDHSFIPEEIAAYRDDFSAAGASVDFVSRIWWGDWRPEKQTFYGDVDPLGTDPRAKREELEVVTDISSVSVRDYAAVLMSANYTSVRLRWTDEPQHNTSVDARRYVQSAPAVRLFREAMDDPHLVKGALCHGLWILAPNPDALSGRKVTCHTVVMADILNAGATVVFQADANGAQHPAPVVVDGDLVTGYSKNEVHDYVKAITERIVALRP